MGPRIAEARGVERRAHDRVIPWLALGVAAVCAVVVWPFLPWVLLALWSAALARPAQAWLTRKLGHRRRVAAFVTTIGLVLAIAPFVIVLALFVVDAVDLARRNGAGDQIQSFLTALGDRQGSGHRPADWLELVLLQGERAWALGQQVAGTTARIMIGLVIAIGGLYGLLVDGERWYRWFEAHAPVAPDALRRLASAVIETGRGLAFGVVGAGLVQAVIAVTLYIALGAPQPLTLGVLTFACSLLPAIGTALVWVPVAIAFAVTGHQTAAIVLFAAGILLIGTIDNLVRPYLARRGQLRLPTIVVALGMFGGVAAWGARGLILGPLALRVLKELLAIWREQRAMSSMVPSLRDQPVEGAAADLGR